MAPSVTVMTQARGEGHVPNGGPGRWLVRLAAGFVLLLLGLVLGSGVPGPHRVVFSAAEQAQQDAEGRFSSLADRARAAATDSPAGAGLFVSLAEDLDAQAAAVALPRRPDLDPATDGSPIPTPTPTPLPTPLPALSDPQGLLAALRNSAEQSLRDAVTAEPGPSRVLAAAGANQWRHAVLLGEMLGVEPGLPPLEAALGVRDPGDTGPQGAPAADAGDCDGAALVSDAGRQALQAARQAEDEARYGYEVGAALLDDPEALLGRARLHGGRADAAALRLGGLCAPVPPPAAGYAIRDGFHADAGAALRELEQDHAELYAGLLSTVDPAERAWIIVSFNAAAQRSLAAGTALEALPGLGAAPG